MDLKSILVSAKKVCKEMAPSAGGDTCLNSTRPWTESLQNNAWDHARHQNEKSAESAKTLLFIPPNSCLHGVVTIHHRLWGAASEKHTKEQIFRHAIGRAASIQPHSRTLAETLFAETITPLEVLDRYTIYGFYSKVLTVPLSEKWGNELKEGDTGANGKRYASKGMVWQRPAFSYCPTCAEDDIQAHGFALWRITHQIPGNEYCHIHKSPLVRSCTKCGRTLNAGNNLSLPGDPCRHCGTVPKGKRGHPSRGALEMAADCEQLYLGEVPELRPMEWATCIRGASLRIGSAEQLAKALAKNLRLTWAGEVSAAAKELYERVVSTRLGREVNLLAMPILALDRLVVFGALRRLGLLPVEELTATSIRASVTALESHVAEQGLPIGVARAVIEGTNTDKIARYVGSTYTRVEKLLLELPPELKQAIPKQNRRTGVFDGVPKLSIEQRKPIYRAKLRLVLQENAISRSEC